MKVLITNDHGVHAQGIIQLAQKVRQHAEVFVVAPNVEQSGVSQAITFLQPLFPVALGGPWDSQDNQIPGYSVNGTPADCVKLALQELCPWRPDLVISGINGGLNAGINVGYSGTVGAALTASTFGILSVALSTESGQSPEFSKVADLAWPLIKQLSSSPFPARTVLNINVPVQALSQNPEVAIVPVETNPMGYHFQHGIDPRGRDYYWATNAPHPDRSEHMTDTQALAAGKITVSAISHDFNSDAAMEHLNLAVKDMQIGDQSVSQGGQSAS